MGKEKKHIIPKAFISYSWSSPEHVDRVAALATRLRENGVDVIFDQWGDLKEGQDVYVYMEKMVTDKDVSKVLVICDELYAEKADGRKGGVGTESQIISKEVYDKVDQNKFIPIVVSMDKDGKPFLPQFFKTRVFIDFTTEKKECEDYEKLIRCIFNKPSFIKPPLGVPPSYIFADQKSVSTTRPLLETLKDAILKDKIIQAGLISDYIDAHEKKFKEFTIDPDEIGDEHLDDIVCAKIKDYKEIRDELLDFIQFLCKYPSVSFSSDNLTNLFQKLLDYVVITDNKIGLKANNLYFCLYELYLYAVAISIKNEKYEIAGNLINAQYFLKNIDYGGGYRIFTSFYAFPETLEEQRKKRLKLSVPSVTADLIRNRSTNDYASHEDIMAVDLVLFIKGKLLGESSGIWYPRSLIYAKNVNKFEPFARAVSRKYYYKNLEHIYGLAHSDFKRALQEINQDVSGHRLGDLKYLIVLFSSWICLDELFTKS